MWKLLYKESRRSSTLLVFVQGDIFVYRLHTLNPKVKTLGVIDSVEFYSYKKALDAGKARLYSLDDLPEYATESIYAGR